MGIYQCTYKKGYDLKDYFNRQIQLWGEEKQFSLQDKTIVIIGSGGLGSSLSIPLGSSGIGTIYMVDFDTVSLTNIHRQIAFRMEDIDKNKADVVCKLLRDRCPFVNAIPKVMDFDAFTKEDIKVDLIIDATDNLPTRKKIDEFAKKSATPWLYGSVEEFNGQVCFFDKASFDVFKITDRKPGGIAAPIVMNIASFQANVALRYLADLPIEKDLLHYFYFNEAGNFELQKFNLPKS
jgi:molybdopterin-synthase adenylyltransferase